MKGKWFTRKLCQWVKAYIANCEDLPLDHQGKWKSSIIDNEELASELNLHLQTVGKFVKAGDLVQYLSCPDVQEQFQLKKTISLATAKC